MGKQHNTMTRKLLEGIRVIDFTRYIAGPLATKVLADHGAEVIKIEGSGQHAADRMGGAFRDNVVGVNRGGEFAIWNTSKLSITLNLAHPKGLEIAKKLVSKSDVVVENFAGGTLQRLGLGYEELRKVKPDIIMLSSCMMGQTGPQASSPGFGPHLAALSGFNQITRWPDRKPVYIGAYTDFVAPLYATIAILAAIEYRRRTGRGQYIDLSQRECGIHFLIPLILDYTANRHIADAMGNSCSFAAPHGSYCCRGNDRWCTIAIFQDSEWKSFCRTIGNPSWTADPRFGTLLSRLENEIELDKLVEDWTVNHTAEEVMSLLQSAGVPAGVVETAEDLLDKDPQLKQRGFFKELDHPEIGKQRVYGPSFILSKSPGDVSHAPLLGEHNEYVFKEILGMSDEDISGLVVENVLFKP